ncbi:MAG: hypothetical protein IH602_22595 [Bryobacteraceae bacterium]|nr:hypothetical protein [Bryobacteraceae bacterium]
MVRLLCLVLAFSANAPVYAAEPRKFQIWSTAGQSSGIAHSVALLEVEAVKGGSLVRYVWAGIGSVGCQDIVVMAWGKRVALSPAALAKPVNPCGAKSRLKQISSRHPLRQPQGHERDTTELVTFCGGPPRSSDIPPGLHFEFKHDQDPDYVYLTHLWDLKDSIMSTTWGRDQPDPDSYDHSAQRDGARFAAQALKLRGSDDDAPQSQFFHFLRQHQGPVDKPVYRWRLEAPPGVKVRHFQEMRLFRSVFCAQFEAAKSTSTQLRFSVDQGSGRVTASTITAESSCWVLSQALIGQARNWAFDPATLPAGGVVDVTVHLSVDCGRQP